MQREDVLLSPGLREGLILSFYSEARAVSFLVRVTGENFRTDFFFDVHC